MADVHYFDQTNPFTLDKLNTSLANIVGAINALAQDSLLNLSPAAGNDGNIYVPKAGGGFEGQISAPSIVVGPSGGPYSSVILKADVNGVGNLALVASGAYDQAELQQVIDKLNVLIAALNT